MKLSIVIPAYNEQDRIGPILEEYAEFFAKIYGSCLEIIVVVDGTDGTKDVVRRISRKFPKKIRCMYSREKQGKGGAIIRGFKACTGDIIGFADADESVTAEEYYRIIRELGDCAIASRKINDSKILKKQPLTRRFASSCFNILVNALFNLNLKDTQCGAKVFRKEVLYAVLPELQCKGFEFDVELLFRIKEKGFKIKEIPIKWKHEEGSSFEMIYAPSMLINLLKLKAT